VGNYTPAATCLPCTQLALLSSRRAKLSLVTFPAPVLGEGAEKKIIHANPIAPGFVCPLLWLNIQYTRLRATRCPLHCASLLLAQRDSLEGVCQTAPATPAHAPSSSQTAADSTAPPIADERAMPWRMLGLDDCAPPRDERPRSHPVWCEVLRWPVFREDRTPGPTITRRHPSSGPLASF
jgi:hypothetical protein